VLDYLSEAVAAAGILLIIGHDQTNRVEGYGGPQDPPSWPPQKRSPR
jgi:hypothetical protein